MGLASDCATEVVAGCAPDSCLGVTTCDSDSCCFTPEKMVVHGYPGCKDFDPIREVMNCIDESRDVAVESVQLNCCGWLCVHCVRVEELLLCSVPGDGERGYFPLLLPPGRGGKSDGTRHVKAALDTFICVTDGRPDHVTFDVSVGLRNAGRMASASPVYCSVAGHAADAALESVEGANLSCASFAECASVEFVPDCAGV